MGIIRGERGTYIGVCGHCGVIACVAEHPGALSTKIVEAAYVACGDCHLTFIRCTGCGGHDAAIAQRDLHRQDARTRCCHDALPTMPGHVET